MEDFYTERSFKSFSDPLPSRLGRGGVCSTRFHALRPYWSCALPIQNISASLVRESDRW